MQQFLDACVFTEGIINCIIIGVGAWQIFGPDAHQTLVKLFG